MIWLVSDVAVTVRFKDRGDVRMAPGVPCQFSDGVARQVLANGNGKVRVHEHGSDVLVQPAAPNARPVYWEDSTGKLCGPATPEFLAKTGTGVREQFWVVVTYQGTTRWVRSDRLQARPKGQTKEKV